MNVFKFWIFTSITLIIIPQSGHGAITAQENGMRCLTRVQCKSNNCVRLGGTSGISYCVAMAQEGEQCTTKPVTGVNALPTCESGLRCSQIDILQDQANTGVCVDPSNTCETCNAWVRVDASNYTGYEAYLHGKCNADCGKWETSYRCASGYYGNASNTTPPTGCQPCPVDGICYERHNTTFYCPSNYYKTESGCTRCPTVGTNPSGTLIYGKTDLQLHTDGIDACYATAGTYTDISGTFELSAQCGYTN